MVEGGYSGIEFCLGENARFKFCFQSLKQMFEMSTGAFILRFCGVVYAVVDVGNGFLNGCCVYVDTHGFSSKVEPSFKKFER